MLIWVFNFKHETWNSKKGSGEEKIIKYVLKKKKKKGKRKRV